MESTNTPDGLTKSQESNSSALSAEQKDALRTAIIESARRLIGIRYKFGAEWENFSALPVEIDCSEMAEGLYVPKGLKMPDGSQNQFDFTVPTGHPVPGDLAFFGRGANTKQIYHVGLIFDEHNIIEARAFDPSAKFETGKVILRPRAAWENYKNFVGYRAHPKLV